MKNLFFTLLAMSIFIISCNKEKKTLKNIAGQWNITSLTVHHSNGSTTDLLGQNTIIMDFQSCEPGNTCDIYTTTSIASTTSTYTSSYIVSENSGAETGFIITVNDTTEYAISTLTNSEMRLTNPVGDSQSGGAVTQGAGTDMTIITLEKL
jgi:hypothetical protein|tara:strand:- start:85 stop:537 length:453 start_codon:yes stop_codon:yes gene_type:complete